MSRLLQGILLSWSLLTVAGCVDDIKEKLQTGFGDIHRWAGPVVPADPHCGHQTTGLMTLNAKEFSFDPFGSVIVLDGNVDQDRLEGSATRGAPGQQGATIRFVGTIVHPGSEPPTIQGTMTSGPCTWSVTLHRG